MHGGIYGLLMLNDESAMDFDRHTLFCSECNDYIYDVEIDEKIVRSEIVSSMTKMLCYG